MFNGYVLFRTVGQARTVAVHLEVNVHTDATREISMLVMSTRNRKMGNRNFSWSSGFDGTKFDTTV